MGPFKNFSLPRVKVWKPLYQAGGVASSVPLFTKKKILRHPTATTTGGIHSHVLLSLFSFLSMCLCLCYQETAFMTSSAGSAHTFRSEDTHAYAHFSIRGLGYFVYFLRVSDRDYVTFAKWHFKHGNKKENSFIWTSCRLSRSMGRAWVWSSSWRSRPYRWSVTARRHLTHPHQIITVAFVAGVLKVLSFPGHISDSLG